MPNQPARDKKWVSVLLKRETIKKLEKLAKFRGKTRTDVMVSLLDEGLSGGPYREDGEGESPVVVGTNSFFIGARFVKPLSRRVEGVGYIIFLTGLTNLKRRKRDGYEKVERIQESVGGGDGRGGGCVG